MVMQLHAPIQPCLWLGHQAEEAARYYVAIFPDSRITHVAHYSEAGRDMHGMAPGTVLTVSFELDGQPFLAINGMPHYAFTQAVSFQVMCDTQEQIDYYWDRLGEGGDTTVRQCGWLKDRFGLSWQVMPTEIISLMTGPHCDAVMTAMMPMQKLDLAALRAAAAPG
jgi:predicted 3-demethylubiquinone-9 3-methyltransferase (glyoxalase superfamily)